MPRYRFAILLAACSLAFMGNFIQYQVSALALDVMPMLGIDAVGFSTMFLIPMLAAVFFGIPLGLAGDKFGPKRVIAICFSVACAGGLLRLLTLQSFPLQLVSLFCVGIGMTALSTNVVKTISLWFGPKTDTAVGVYYAVSCLGIVASQAAGGLYSSVSQAYALAEAVLVAVTLLWVAVGRDLPKGAEAPADKAALETFLVPAKSRSVWLIALAVGFTLSASTAFAGLLPQALEAGKGIEGLVAGNMAAAVTVASIFGCVAGPTLCARFGRMRPYLLVVNILAGAVMLSTWYVGLGTPLWAVLAAGGFLSAMTGPILQSLPVVIEGIGSRFAGSASGIISTVSLAMSFALPIGVSAVAGSSYELNLALESICFVASILPIMLLPELGKRAQRGQAGAESERQGTR